MPSREARGFSGIDPGSTSGVHAVIAVRRDVRNDRLLSESMENGDLKSGARIERVHPMRRFSYEHDMRSKFVN